MKKPYQVKTSNFHNIITNLSNYVSSLSPSAVFLFNSLYNGSNGNSNYGDNDGCDGCDGGDRGDGGLGFRVTPDHFFLLVGIIGQEASDIETQPAIHPLALQAKFVGVHQFRIIRPDGFSGVTATIESA